MKQMKHLFFMSCFFLALDNIAANAAIKLRSFETDYCTMFLDGPTDKPGLWKHCCLEHDLRYWFGGNQAEMDRSDMTLRGCVSKVAGDNWADLIYYGVRTGHYSPIKNKYQWSWGWEPKRQNLALNQAETAMVAGELRNLNLLEINMEDFIKENLPLAK